MAVAAGSPDRFREYQTAAVRDLWGAWKIYGLMMYAYLVIAMPLFSPPPVGFVQGCIDLLVPASVTLLLWTILFGTWGAFSFWQIKNLILKRFPADVPAERLHAPLERVRLVITFLGVTCAFGFGLLVPFRQYADDVAVFGFVGYYWAARFMAESAQKCYATPQDA